MTSAREGGQEAGREEGRERRREGVGKQAIEPNQESGPAVREQRGSREGGRVSECGAVGRGPESSHSAEKRNPLPGKAVFYLQETFFPSLFFHSFPLHLSSPSLPRSLPFSPLPPPPSIFSSVSAPSIRLPAALRSSGHAT